MHLVDVYIPVQAVLLLSKLPTEMVGNALGVERLCDAVNVILSLQVFNSWLLL